MRKSAASVIPLRCAFPGAFCAICPPPYYHNIVPKAVGFKMGSALCDIIPFDMQLNLGCGHDKRDGFVNVDKQKECGPDLVVDLEQLPWPWETSSVDEIVLKHALEHLGRDPDTYLAIVKEIWRVCKPDAMITIVVPHART